MVRPTALAPPTSRPAANTCVQQRERGLGASQGDQQLHVNNRHSPTGEGLRSPQGQRAEYTRWVQQGEGLGRSPQGQRAEYTRWVQQGEGLRSPRVRGLNTQGGFSKVRAFGAHRVRGLNTQGGFSKVRAFGAHRVRGLNTQGGFSKVRAFSEGVRGLRNTQGGFSKVRAFGAHRVRGLNTQGGFSKVRAFGAHRVRGLNTQGGFSKVRAFGAHRVRGLNTQGGFSKVRAFGAHRVRGLNTQGGFSKVRAFGAHRVRELNTQGGFNKVRAFGAHRVRGLNTQGTSHRTSHSLSKLYSTILQQRQSKEQRRGRPRETPHIPPVPSESTGTDNSVIPADSASSTSTYTLPSHRGPSHSKKAVKHVNKGVQAGDLEIVSNGTRRHTRDVGTTFPSPGSARGARVLPSSHSGSKRGRAGDRSPPKTQRKRKMSQPSARPYYPQGVSWYIPAEDLRAEGRKENRPEQQPLQGPAWFEPYSRTTRPWREPLRQRQIQDRERLTDRLQTNQLEADRDRPSERQLIKHSIITPPGPEPTGNAPAALVRISLQEALELRRPEFVSRSRERVKRLVLQGEERKLQVVFSRERNELFNQPRRPGRLAQPAGTAVFQRAVPKKEMVQRSKQRSGLEQEAGSNNRGARRRRIYEQLPEVQRRREEEKRREEYRSYRLNAQLYNKRITNRVLGRQTPWQ
ncbi:uncharacterized protein LOC135536288 [Oncorhynchus masou masou]|uniref:uncharacterized protein LOC135536288 n=1 Tax=Oncorhynchus masou masou TaxID=90313 RepID=UPI003183ABAB